MPGTLNSARKWSVLLDTGVGLNLTLQYGWVAVILHAFHRSFLRGGEQDNDLECVVLSCSWIRSQVLGCTHTRWSESYLRIFDPTKSSLFDQCDYCILCLIADHLDSLEEMVLRAVLSGPSHELKCYKVRFSIHWIMLGLITRVRFTFYCWMCNVVGE